MSTENMRLQPESGEAKRNKRLSNINLAIKRFVIAGLVLEAAIGGSMLAIKNADSLKVGTEISRDVDESKKPVQEIETKKTIDLNTDRQKAEKEFDDDFQFEYEQLAHLKEREAKLLDIFGDIAPMEAHHFMQDLGRLRLNAVKLSREDRSRWKIFFEEKFFPRVVEEDSHPQLEAIETGEGRINLEMLRSILATFPRNWVNGQISAISQTDKVEVIEKDGVRWTKDADFRFTNEKITLYKNIKTHPLGLFAHVLAHESAHANDWKGNNRASYEDKLNLLFKLIGRLDSDERFKSEYAESKLKDSENTKLNRYLYAQEYWADICAQYFQDPTQLSMDDFEIVDAWVKKSDPNFNPTTSNEQRTQILGEIAKK